MVCRGVCAKLFAQRVHVLWMCGEVHEDKRQGGRGSFAAGADDKARLAVEEGATCGAIWCVGDKMRDKVGFGVFHLTDE